MTALIHHGEIVEWTRAYTGHRFHAVMCDPPYELGLMGRKWDSSGVAFNPDTWRAIASVCKPGAMLLAFGGTRTFHRIAVAIEDAGWEIRDTIMWVYGQGFPKSLNLKGEWSGYGTALKPAYEPVIVARLPLDGTVAQNVQAHGTGALAIDACRVKTTDKLGGGTSNGPTTVSECWDRPFRHDADKREHYAQHAREKIAHAESIGRWPANVIHDGSDEVVTLFPDSAGGAFKGPTAWKRNNGIGLEEGVTRIGASNAPDNYGDTGSVARFFYCAKASTSERSAGLYERNAHPTVKPLALTEYLARLILPPELDEPRRLFVPFAGSGSEIIGARRAGWDEVEGVEMESAHVDIARSRIAHWEVAD